MAYASQHGGILSDDACRSAACAYGTLPGRDRRLDYCDVPYDRHTCEHALVLQSLPGYGKEALLEILQNPEVKALMAQYQLSGVALEPAAEVRAWSVVVQCKAVTPREEQDFDDQRDKPEGPYTFTVQAVDREQAVELAMGEFHATVPIANLEDFDVVATALGLEESTTIQTVPL